MLERKGRLWVTSDQGEEVKITDRFELRYTTPERIYVIETEPSLGGRPLYIRTLKRKDSPESLSTEERERILQRIVAMLQFSQDEFELIQ